MNTPGHTPPRVDFAVCVRGPLLVPIVQTMQRVWAIVEITQLRNSDVPLFPDEEPAENVGTQVAKFTIRDNLRHRRDIERAYLAAHAHGAPRDPDRDRVFLSRAFASAARCSTRRRAASR